MLVQRWVYFDPALNETYTVPMNPREMTSIFPEKSVTIHQTTAVDGKALLFEGSTPPVAWSFVGTTLDREHHDELLYWSEKRNRITITDHFGRVITCYLTRFDAVPQPAPETPRKWRHSYTMHALILGKPTPATVL